MIDYKIKQHIELDEQFQGVNITEFFYSDTSNLSNGEIITDFIHSKHIENDCIRNSVKNSPHKDEYLKGAFELSELNSGDFKKSSKEEIESFLSDVLAEPDWHEDIEDFKKILNKFIDFLRDLKTNEYYLINKVWFEDLYSNKTRPESWVYNYYFLILWIDNNSKIIGYSEWDSD
jgi:hypothetical protein